MLCVYKLSHLVEQEVVSGNWITVKMGSQGPRISHLIFTDDFLLFGEATKKQMQCVMETLQNFCSLTGHEVSEEKSNILLFSNVTRSFRHKLLQISKFGETIQFDKYLGVPLSGKTFIRGDF